jgi:hypothetical protein
LRCGAAIRNDLASARLVKPITDGSGIPRKGDNEGSVAVDGRGEEAADIVGLAAPPEPLPITEGGFRRRAALQFSAGLAKETERQQIVRDRVSSSSGERTLIQAMFPSVSA